MLMYVALLVTYRILKFLTLYRHLCFYLLLLFFFFTHFSIFSVYSVLSFQFYSSFRVIFMMALNDLTGPSAGPLARIPYFIPL